MSENANARRTLEKAEDVLKQCRKYFGSQAEMNAAGHMSDRVMYPPIHAAIESALMGIDTFRDTYPEEST